MDGKTQAEPKIISKIMSTVMIVLVWDIARSRGLESRFCAPFGELCLVPLYFTLASRLHLGLLETVLPQADVGGDTVLAVVEEDNPVKMSVYWS